MSLINRKAFTYLNIISTIRYITEMDGAGVDVNLNSHGNDKKVTLNSENNLVDSTKFASITKVL